MKVVKIKIGSNKIDISNILIVLCLLAYIRPEYLITLNNLNNVYNLYRILIAVVIFALYLSRKRHGKFILIWILFELWIVGITVIRGGDISYAVKQAITVISLLALFELNSKNISKIFKSILFVLEIYIYINLISMIVFPEGLYVTGNIIKTNLNWFLGFKNKHIIYYLPATGLLLILGKLEGFNFRKKMLFIVTIFSAIISNSSTSLICMAVISLIGFLPVIRKHYKLFNMFTYIAISIVVFFAITIFRLQYIFTFIIVNILGKKLDLTYRTNLWDRALSAIAKHPIIGLGEQTNDVKHQFYNSSSIITAHNQILEYLYVGGIVLLILYILINLYIAKKTWKIRNNEAVQVTTAMYFALQIALIAEVYTDATIFMIYFCAYYIGNLIKQYNQKKDVLERGISYEGKK